MHPRLLTALCVLAGTLPAQPAAADGPQTAPEASAHGRTSTLADVQAFLAALTSLPHADRLQVAEFGRSHEDRPLLSVRAALPGPADGDRLRALVLGNIHAGEVEGKEAVQVLLREIALGRHADLLRRVEVTFVPIYNVDGNERIDRKNRASQNGPDGGVGQRANAQGLDLNRDFVKTEAPETRALLGLITRLDPHLFLDLHTTNGSHHGYHLTYAPALNPNVDPGIAALSRTLLDGVRVAMDRDHGLQCFDYGNFETRDWEGSGAPESKGQRGWWTYDWRARYLVNGFGLRNRIGVLSEAYSYCDFATRIAATRAFVLETLRWCAREHGRIAAACALADRRLAQPDAPVWFGHDTVFGDPEWLPVLVGGVERVELPDGLGVRLRRTAEARPETMPVVRRFRARQQEALPAAWALPDPPAAVRERLLLHGIVTTTLAEPRQAAVAVFGVTQKRKPKRPFQGHQELELRGEWQKETRLLPAGTLLVDARQPLGRLAATLLEPRSEDGLSTWNFLEERTGDDYPIVRVTAH